MPPTRAREQRPEELGVTRPTSLTLCGSERGPVERLLTYPILDHALRFAQRRAGKRGPARRARVFLVSRPSRALSAARVEDALRALRDRGVRGAFEECTFRGRGAWLVVLANPEVDLAAAVDFARAKTEAETGAPSEEERDFQAAVRLIELKQSRR